jgi:hypothetical protein
MKLKRIFHRISNIIRWFPVIWSDNDWDFQYFYDILAFKIENMLKYYDKSAILCEEDKQEIVKDLLRCSQLLDKLTNNLYEEEAFSDYYYKYPGDYFDHIQIERNGKQVWKWVDNRTDEMKKEFRECSIKATELEEQCRKELFQLISDKINFWWE